MIGAKILYARADPNPTQIEAVGVPTCLDYQIRLRQPIRLKPASLGKERHLDIRGIEPGAEQFMRVLRRRQAVLGIVIFRNV